MTPKKPIRVGDGGLVRRVPPAKPRLREVLKVDRGRKAVHVAMPITLGLVEAHAARKDDIPRARKQIVLQRDHRFPDAPRKRESSSMLS